tara:strand:+ start:8306 stop:10522 length:2217 start_codon:yes stop_codon:yes gene_type:complete
MGGVAGHLAHLYDNRELTFNKMKKILSLASNGDIIGTEKTDGYNIFLGYKNGVARYARNKGDMKIGGRSMEDLAAREFQGGAAVKKVYIDAFRAYEMAVNSLTPEEKVAIFGPEGHIFYNTEIQGPGASNVVNYDANVISIHAGGHRMYDDEEDKVEVIDASKNSEVLDRVIDKFEQATANEDFSVRKTAFLKLKALDDDYDLNIALSKIQKAGFSGDMTIEEFLEQKLKFRVDEKLSYLNTVTRQQIVNRILDKRGEDGKPLATLTQIYKGFPIEQKKIIKDFVGRGKTMLLEAIWPIEDAIHDFAVELLRGLKSAYILDNEAEVKRLKKEVDQAIKAIQAYQGPGYEEAHEVLAKQLKKIKHQDNINTAVEGFVFQYDGQLYKFTGNFAPANQILGLFRYGRGNVKIPKPETEPVVGESDILSENEGRIVALVPGKFKPPHAGHLEMVEHYSQLADEVVVMVSPLPKAYGDGKEITHSDSIAIWNIYIANAGLDNVKVIKSPQNSPVGASFDFVANKEGNKDYSRPGDRILLGASTKGGDQSRFAGDVQKYAQDGVTVMDPMKYAFVPTPPELNATDFRNALANKEDISKYLPVSSQNDADSIFNIIDDQDSQKKTLTMEALFSLVETVMTEKKMTKGDKNRETRLKKKMDKDPSIKKDFVKRYGKEEGEKVYFATIRKRSMKEDEEIEEISSMASGDVQGASGQQKKGKRDDEYLIREKELDINEEVLYNIAFGS